MRGNSLLLRCVFPDHASWHGPSRPNGAWRLGAPVAAFGGDASRVTRNHSDPGDL